MNAKAFLQAVEREGLLHRKLKVLDMTTCACPQTLPSGDSAYRLVSGEAGALPLVVAHWAVRAGIIWLGLYIGGAPRKDLVRWSLCGSAAIELFVLGWVASRRP